MGITGNWDQKVVDYISSRDRGELSGIRDWIERHADQLACFTSSIETDHPALWWSSLMTNIETSIDKGDEQAIAIGYRFILDDPKSPFGRIHKRRVLKRLRRNVNTTHKRHLAAVRDLIHKFGADDHKPQEYGDILRLEATLDAIRGEGR